LESEFGSSIIPTLASIQIPIPTTIHQLVSESSSFTNGVSDEEELRVSNFRSQIRGISALFDYVADGLSGDEYSDSIEDKKFTLCKNRDCLEAKFFDQFLLGKVDVKSLLNDLEKLCNSLGTVDNGDATPTVAGGTNILDDRDVGNVFDLVANLVRIFKHTLFRNQKYFNESIQDEFVAFAIGTISTIQSSRSDILVGGQLVLECIDIVGCWFKAIWAKARNGNILMAENFLNVILKSVICESIELCDNSSDDGDIMVDIATGCLEIIDVAYRLSGQYGSPEMASILVCAMSTLTDKNICVSVACTLMETSFVVFGETNNDAILGQVDWRNIYSSIGVYLSQQVSNSRKFSRTDKSEYISGTIENIKAFIEYKGTQ
jgi:hypothetical protein